MLRGTRQKAKVESYVVKASFPAASAAGKRVFFLMRVSAGGFAARGHPCPLDSYAGKQPVRRRGRRRDACPR